MVGVVVVVQGYMVVQELDIFSCSDVSKQVVVVELVELEDLEVRQGLEDLVHLGYLVLLEDLVVPLDLVLLDLLVVPSFQGHQVDLELEEVVVEGVVGVEVVEVGVEHMAQRVLME